MHTAIQLAGLFVGLMFTASNVIRASYKNSVSAANIVYMAAGWTAFIWATWLS